MSQEDKFTAERKRNRVAYAIEDFYDSVADLRNVWLGNIALAVFAAAAIVFGGDNGFHVIYSLLTALVVYAVQHYVDLVSWRNLLGITVIYALSVVVEYLCAGLPEPILPFLTVEEGWVGFIPFVNSLSPLLYVGVRFVLVYVAVNVCLRRRTLGSQPTNLLRQLDRELAQRLE